ncbi:transcriptional regulator, IclR family [Paraburkholderia caballeronis]|uniref:Transcriptional regulator, IclR family n=1 Tax=Paraburkholderia caballeronis TaxID=416943 RepID=A0A1H7S5E5_9BURK|nr:IclR family transcriptional regulator [Paraburkholderia caballeronis]PXW97265.1 IclR family transcriptional regulator [Paraburkholderia caballeronis]RAJ93785.1 IclR family transcriptional regulator [Paraburkholderia caballeronis]SED58669.1 transcriptional regulator, IclR family [Paraburkholderia caballeronis]SEL67466.1 transcriptional regulator, IclR family [Paraburkholderia caballeronis]
MSVVPGGRRPHPRRLHQRAARRRTHIAVSTGTRIAVTRHAVAAGTIGLKRGIISPMIAGFETAAAGFDKRESASSVGRVFAIPRAPGDTGRIGISELSQRLGLSKTTVHRVLQALKAPGYVVQEVETDVEMRGIAQATREAVHLGAFDENAIIDIHKIDADYGLRMQSRIGRRNPLYSTAIGKVLLAGMDPADAREVLSHVEFRKSTQKTLASAEPG